MEGTLWVIVFGNSVRGKTDIGMNMRQIISEENLKRSVAENWIIIGALSVNLAGIKTGSQKVLGDNRFESSVNLEGIRSVCSR